MPTPKLKTCPFCGEPASMAEFGHHMDPYTGKHTPDIRVGCPSAFTAGTDPARCPVAPIICQLTNPTIDIVAAWNRRAGDKTKKRRNKQRCIHWRTDDSCVAYGTYARHECLGAHECPKYAVKEGEA